MSIIQQAYRYECGHLEILDVLRLPGEEVYEQINNVEDCFGAINEMKVRGAPLVAVVGALSVAVELHKRDFAAKEKLASFIDEKLNRLLEARSINTNMKKTFTEIQGQVKNKLDQRKPYIKTKKEIIAFIEQLEKVDAENNKNLANLGAEHILEQNVDIDQLTVMTHSNTGTLATCGYGTALGVVRALAEKGKLKSIFITETRPHNEGSRLAGKELLQDNLPATLIVDSAAAFAMKKKNVSAVVVGANLITANGDTVNKIGTYQLALAAEYHNIPFYVCATSNGIDTDITSGQNIKVDERHPGEVTHLLDVRICAEGIDFWNPPYDVIPAKLITKIITEKGIFDPDDIHRATM